MASLKDIRARIESTKNTQQITRAMKLVSAAKLRKAQNQIVGMRPYAQTLMKVIADIAATEKVQHPLLSRSSNPKKLLMVVVTSDRGLCGGFNTNITKFTENFLKANRANFDTVDFIFVGKRSADYFSKRGVKPVQTIIKLDKDISYGLAKEFAEKMIHHFLEGHYDEIRMVFNEFKSAISQKPVMETLLPVDLAAHAAPDESNGFAKDMIFEPAPELIMDELLKKHFVLQVYKGMSESVAAEHGARMTAMENATNNARDVLAKLTLTYNKARQEKITTELTEIVSGAEAL